MGHAGIPRGGGGREAGRLEIAEWSREEAE